MVCSDSLAVNVRSVDNRLAHGRRARHRANSMFARTTSKEDHAHTLRPSGLGTKGHRRAKAATRSARPGGGKLYADNAGVLAAARTGTGTAKRECELPALWRLIPATLHG